MENKLEKFLEEYSWIDDYIHHVIDGDAFEKFMEGKKVVEQQDLDKLIKKTIKYYELKMNDISERTILGTAHVSYKKAERKLKEIKEKYRT